MDERQVYEELTQIFHELFGDEAIKLSAATTAADVEGWDSFNNINIIAAAEERFGVKIGTREVEKLDSVGALVALILAKTGR